MAYLHAIEEYLLATPWAAWIALIIAFIVLAKCADIFVDSAVALADKFSIPKLVIGLVLVSFATTAPELSVSMLAALQGEPEMAMGNAIGSVICNSGLALGLAGVLAAMPIIVMPKVLKTSGLFLIIVEVVAFLFVFRDFTLSWWEGLTLVILFLIYTGFLFHLHRKGVLNEDCLEEEVPADVRRKPVPFLLAMFLLAFLGIIGSSEFIVTSARSIALSVGIPESVIALTLVAFGTSVPEVATCVMAVRKGHGEVAVGNILGANILNICWVAGASSIANELVLGRKEILFMFPAMFIIVGIMLIMMRQGYRLTRLQGGILLAVYVIYLIVLVQVFPPEIQSAPPDDVPGVEEPVPPEDVPGAGEPVAP